MSTTTTTTRPHYAHVIEIEGKTAAVFTSRAAAVKYIHSIGRRIFDAGVTITKWNTTTGERVYGRAKLTNKYTTMKETNIFNQFELHKLIYEVRPGGSCKGCAFYIEEENHCDNSYDLQCSALLRKDNNNVIFVKIGEVED